MLKVFIGVIRFPDDRDFIMMVDGEPQPVEDAVREVIEEIWGEGEITVLTEGVDFREFVHARNAERQRADGYILGCEVTGMKRMNYAQQYARRLRHLNPDNHKS